MTANDLYPFTLILWYMILISMIRGTVFKN